MDASEPYVYSGTCYRIMRSQVNGIGHTDTHTHCTLKWEPVNSVETLSDWKSLNHDPFLNAVIVSKFAYGSRTLQVEVNLITYKNYTQSISYLGVRPHRHVYTAMTQQNTAYSWNIINKSTLTHALLLVVPRPSLPTPVEINDLIHPSVPSCLLVAAVLLHSAYCACITNCSLSPIDYAS